MKPCSVNTKLSIPTRPGLPRAVLVLRDLEPLVDRMPQRLRRRRPACLLCLGNQTVQRPARRVASGIVSAAHHLPEVDRPTGDGVRPGVDPDTQRVTPRLDVTPRSFEARRDDAAAMPQRNSCPNPCPKINSPDRLSLFCLVAGEGFEPSKAKPTDLQSTSKPPLTSTNAPERLGCPDMVRRVERGVRLQQVEGQIGRRRVQPAQDRGGQHPRRPPARFSQGQEPGNVATEVAHEPRHIMDAAGRQPRIPDPPAQAVPKGCATSTAEGSCSNGPRWRHPSRERTWVMGALHEMWSSQQEARQVVDWVPEGRL